MRINTNIAALQAQRQLDRTTRALGRALERLSSGRRINFARDDAAGLAVTTGLEATRRSLMRGIQNMNEAVGFLNTAESSMASQVDIVQRMRELAIQSSNGTLGVEDRSSLDREFQALLAEFDRISSESNFNGVNLLDGTFDSLRLQVGSTRENGFDMSLESTDSNSIFTRLTSDATFDPARSYANNSLLSFIGVGDLNGDGFDDVVAPDRFAGLGSRIYLSQGDGTFALQSTIGAGLSLGQPVVGDFNEDGKLDILMKRNASTNIHLFIGRGDGNFDAGGTFADTSTASEHMLAKDINNDGHLDLVSANNNEPSIFLGNGNGSFSFLQTISMNSNRSISLGDIDSDGDLDLVGGGQGSNLVSISLNQGGGNFATVTSLDTAMWSNDLELADFTGDGVLDIATGFSTSIKIYRGGGDGNFSLHTTLTTGGTGFNRMSVGDFDADGASDILMTEGNLSFTKVFLNSGNGTFTAQATLSGFTTAGHTAVLDMNGDGIDDFVVADNTSNFYTFKNQAYLTSAVPQMDLTTQENAQNVLEFLDDGLNALLERRTGIGAQLSRLDAARESGILSVENLSAALSQGRDVDYAEETATLVQNQILQQAAVSVLSQANFSLQLALQLLKP